MDGHRRSASEIRLSHFAFQKTPLTGSARGGIALRVDITPDELKALRIYAIEHGTTVPKLIAEEVRKLSKRAK